MMRGYFKISLLLVLPSLLGCLPAMRGPACQCKPYGYSRAAQACHSHHCKSCACAAPASDSANAKPTACAEPAPCDKSATCAEPKACLCQQPAYAVPETPAAPVRAQVEAPPVPTIPKRLSSAVTASPEKNAPIPRIELE